MFNIKISNDYTQNETLVFKNAFLYKKNYLKKILKFYALWKQFTKVI